MTASKIQTEFRHMPNLPLNDFVEAFACLSSADLDRARHFLGDSMDDHGLGKMLRYVYGESSDPVLERIWWKNRNRNLDFDPLRVTFFREQWLDAYYFLGGYALRCWSRLYELNPAVVGKFLSPTEIDGQLHRLEAAVPSELLDLTPLFQKLNVARSTTSHFTKKEFYETVKAPIKTTFKVFETLWLDRKSDEVKRCWDEIMIWQKNFALLMVKGFELSIRQLLTAPEPPSAALSFALSYFADITRRLCTRPARIAFKHSIFCFRIERYEEGRLYLYLFHDLARDNEWVKNANWQSENRLILRGIKNIKEVLDLPSLKRHELTELVPELFLLEKAEENFGLIESHLATGDYRALLDLSRGLAKQSSGENDGLRLAMTDRLDNFCRLTLYPEFCRLEKIGDRRCVFVNGARFYLTCFSKGHDFIELGPRELSELSNLYKIAQRHRQLLKQKNFSQFKNLLRLFELNKILCFDMVLADIIVDFFIEFRSFDKAHALLEEMRQSIDSYEEQSRIYQKRGRFYLVQALGCPPDDPRRTEFLGEALDKFSKSIDLRSVRTNDPFAAYIGKAQVERKLGRYEESLKTLRLVLRSKSDSTPYITKTEIARTHWQRFKDRDQGNRKDDIDNAWEKIFDVLLELDVDEGDLTAVDLLMQIVEAFPSRKPLIELLRHGRLSIQIKAEIVEFCADQGYFEANLSEEIIKLASRKNYWIASPGAYNRMQGAIRYYLRSILLDSFFNYRDTDFKARLAEIVSLLVHQDLPQEFWCYLFLPREKEFREFWTEAFVDRLQEIWSAGRRELVRKVLEDPSGGDFSELADRVFTKPIRGFLEPLSLCLSHHSYFGAEYSESPVAFSDFVGQLRRPISLEESDLRTIRLIGRECVHEPRIFDQYGRPTDFSIATQWAAKTKKLIDNLLTAFSKLKHDEGLPLDLINLSFQKFENNLVITALLTFAEDTETELLTDFSMPDLSEKWKFASRSGKDVRLECRVLARSFDQLPAVWRVFHKRTLSYQFVKPGDFGNFYQLLDTMPKVTAARIDEVVDFMVTRFDQHLAVLSERFDKQISPTSHSIEGIIKMIAGGYRPNEEFFAAFTEVLDKAETSLDSVLQSFKSTRLSNLDLVSSIRNRVERVLRPYKNQIAWRFETNLDFKMFRISKYDLHLILFNILSNAIRAIDTEFGTILLRLESVGNTIFLSIYNTGPTEIAGQTGLGEKIVSRIIKSKLGGEVELGPLPESLAPYRYGWNLKFPAKRHVSRLAWASKKD